MKQSSLQYIPGRPAEEYAFIKEKLNFWRREMSRFEKRVQNYCPHMRVKPVYTRVVRPFDVAFDTASTMKTNVKYVCQDCGKVIK